MQNFDHSEKKKNNNEEELFSHSMRAGKKSYFFDVRATHGDDYYITITESKKKKGDDGCFVFEKHKIFLYKEDFQEFVNGLNKSIDFIRTNKPEFFKKELHGVNESLESVSKSATDIEFDLL